ncbi:type II toxin-antitoxin system PemK/MazF family toxin [Magnetovibrio sp. PR-2]|uniref:type II toxin-antitoxin system PemK/MazF family toxin n=1 Tax=Magnetovibrio sp. PR-2 TaxID=3120356 RepID=UPI002FCDEBC9
MTSSKKIEVGDIVLCRFPSEERPGMPGAKMRPCLVVKVRRKTQFTRGAIEVVYGTSVSKKKPGTAIRVTSQQDLESAGLRKPSKFLMGKRAHVPIKGNFMGSRIGRLPDHYLPHIQKHLNQETNSERLSARRFGRKQQPSNWTTSSELLKEFQHA